MQLYSCRSGPPTRSSGRLVGTRPLAIHFIGIRICNFKFPSLGASGFALGASGAGLGASGPGLGASGPAASPLGRDVMKIGICNLMHLQIICKPQKQP